MLLRMHLALKGGREGGDNLLFFNIKNPHTIPLSTIFPGYAELNSQNFMLSHWDQGHCIQKPGVSYDLPEKVTLSTPTKGKKPGKLP